MDSKFLYLALVFDSISVGILMTVIPLYIKSMGADSVTLGFVYSVYAIAFIIASPIWGRMSDIWGRKLALCLGLFGYSLTVLFYSFANSPFQMLPIRLLQGFTDATYWTVPIALATDLSKPSELGEAIGRIGVLQGIGQIAGPSIGGILIRVFSYSAAFYFCSVLSFSAAILIFLGIKVKKRVIHTEKTGVEGTERFWSSFNAKMKKSFAAVYFDSMLPALSLGVIASILPVHADSVLKGDKFLVGLLLTSYYISVPLIQPVAGKISDMKGRRSAILIALATIVLGFSTLAFSFSFSSFLISMVILGAGVGQLNNGLKTALMDLAPPSKRGFVSGLQSIAWGIGYFLGPMMGGLLAATSINAPYIFCAALSSCGSILTLTYYSRAEKKKETIGP